MLFNLSVSLSTFPADFAYTAFHMKQQTSISNSPSFPQFGMTGPQLVIFVENIYRSFFPWTAENFQKNLNQI